MADPHLQALQDAMARAIADEDFEQAACLRDQIAALNGGPSSRLKRGVPGAMGLGTDQPVGARLRAGSPR